MTEFRLRGAALVVREGALLLVEHREAARTYYSPPGGGIRPGEDVRAGVVREVVEETGHVVSLGDLIGARQFEQEELGRSSVELFFRAEVARDDLALSRTASEPLGRVRWVPLDALRSGEVEVLPSFLREPALLERLRQDRGAAFLREAQAPVEPPEGELPDALLRSPELGAFLRQTPLALRTDSSHSGAVPLLAENPEGERLVLRPCHWGEGRWLLRLTEDLRTRVMENQELLGSPGPLYARLRGDGEGRPWGSPGSLCFVVQDFCPAQDPRDVYRLRDLDVRDLGGFCGRLQASVLDRVPRALWPPALGTHPLAWPLHQRIRLCETRLGGAGLEHLSAPFAEWLCQQVSSVIAALKSLGAPDFPQTLVDRDLNSRNCALDVGGGAARIRWIFDPDFCRGSVGDALRVPGLSFSAANPRDTLVDILNCDPNTLGSPRWFLFLRGFLEGYRTAGGVLANEEIVAIPLLEKLEILIFRLFERHPRYLVGQPEVFVPLFRDMTRVLVDRIDSLDWHARMRDLLAQGTSFAFRKLSGGAEPAEASLERRALRVLEEAVPSLGRTDSRVVLDLEEAGCETARWTLEANRGNGAVRLAVGYPFPLRTHDLPAAPGWDLKLSFHGEALREVQRKELLELLEERSAGSDVVFRTLDPAELSRLSEPLAAAGPSQLLLLDPFGYLGDSSYVALYHRMLRELNLGCSVTVLTRSPELWRCFDCRVARDLADVPEQLCAAVLPAPMDEHWSLVLRLVPALLQRTNLILVPQRDLVIRSHPPGRRTEICHGGGHDTVLASTSIALYTWDGLNRLLPRRLSLATAMDLFPPSRTWLAPQIADLVRPGVQVRNVFLNAFSSSDFKDLPVDLASGVLERILGLFGPRVRVWVSAGRPGCDAHRQVAERIAASAPAGSDVQVVANRLDELVTVMTSMDLVVTADTSLAHLAGHKGIPCVVLWNERRWSPTSVLDQIHNGPAGFAHPGAFHLDATFRRDSGVPADDPVRPEDLARAAGALDLMARLLAGALDQVFTAPAHDVETLSADLLRDTQDLEDRLYGLEAVGAEALSRRLAGQGRRLLEMLRDEWREWLTSTPTLLDPRQVLRLLDRPHESVWVEDLRRMSELEALRFRHSLWSNSALLKLARTVDELRRAGRRRTAKRLLRDASGEYPLGEHLKGLFGNLERLVSYVREHGTPIRQAYLEGPEWRARIDAEVLDALRPEEGRIRDSGGDRRLTVKTAGSRVRREYSQPLEAEVFEKLWEGASRRLRKRRLVLPYAGTRLTLDVFEDRDLVLAELELSGRGEEGAEIGLDVTERPEFLNRNLAREVAGVR